MASASNNGRNWNEAPEQLRDLVERPGFLTDRQRDVIKLEWLGFGQRRIALVLGIDRSTVRLHRDRALQKIAHALETENERGEAA